MRVQNTLPVMYNSEVKKKIAALTKRSLFMFIFLISDFGKISVQPHLYYAYINNPFFKCNYFCKIV